MGPRIMGLRKPALKKAEPWDDWMLPQNLGPESTGYIMSPYFRRIRGRTSGLLPSVGDGRATLVHSSACAARDSGCNCG